MAPDGGSSAIHLDFDARRRRSQRYAVLVLRVLQRRVSMMLAATLALVVTAPAQAASYKRCRSFVAMGGFPYYTGVKAKRMSCSTAKRWLNTRVSDAFMDTMEETGGAEALDGERLRLRRRGRPPTRAGSRCVRAGTTRT
jgi:hypothetical protein